MYVHRLIYLKAGDGHSNCFEQRHFSVVVLEKALRCLPTILAEREYLTISFTCVSVTEAGSSWAGPCVQTLQNTWAFHVHPISLHSSIFKSYTSSSRSVSNISSHWKTSLILSTCRNVPFSNSHRSHFVIMGRSKCVLRMFLFHCSVPHDALAHTVNPQ